MTVTYSAIDLPNLPAPQSITPVSFEQEFHDLLELFQKLYPDFSTPLESDPVYKLLETFAYRLAVEKQRRNEAIKGVMLAYATGNDLDQLGANLNVQRLVIEPANTTTTPPSTAILENDNDFRQRIQLSFEQYSTAGSVGSYVYHARSASGAVADVQVTSPTPGEVVLYVMGRNGQGTADDTLLNAVKKAVTDETVRPLTDNVTVQSAIIIPYQITATLELYPGPDAEVVKKNAYNALNAYCASVHRIGYLVATSGIYAALQQPGVQTVVLNNWDGDRVPSDGHVNACSDITLTTVGGQHGTT